MSTSIRHALLFFVSCLTNFLGSDVKSVPIGHCNACVVHTNAFHLWKLVGISLFFHCYYYIIHSFSSLKSHQGIKFYNWSAISWLKSKSQIKLGIQDRIFDKRNVCGKCNKFSSCGICLSKLLEAVIILLWLVSILNHSSNNVSVYNGRYWRQLHAECKFDDFTRFVWYILSLFAMVINGVLSVRAYFRSPVHS